ncbi:HNH endonuclease [Aliarcobacter butzleri]|uniref:HNH endonuclease n=1 Tax=Aliarcobacter butzleri TaxID=28197 RepID=UPI0024DEC7CA|nr:HNH endonuclease [Aliarcobacter butzleri]MDK2050881.1 HNH endonuclease [Aliarcobacter butzleri]
MKNWWSYGITPHGYYDNEKEQVKTNDTLKNLLEDTWSITANITKIKYGDILIIKVGIDKRNDDILKNMNIPKLINGVYAIAEITEVNTDDKTISFIVLRNFFDKPLRGQALNFNPINTRGRNCRKLEKEIIDYFTPYLDDYFNQNLEQPNYSEGNSKNVTSIIYERNEKARQECLNIHGYNCKVCDLSFEEMYGDIGKDYIHVHHLYPMYLGSKRDTNPKNDLVPVCPNCHVMLHKKKGLEPYTIEELRKLIKK